MCFANVVPRGSHQSAGLRVPDEIGIEDTIVIFVLHAIIVKGTFFGLIGLQHNSYHAFINTEITAQAVG